jgi:serine/threonine-protein kinase RsbW
MSVFRQSIASRVDEIPKLADALAAFLEPHAVPFQVRHNIQLAVDEIASNIVKYAYDASDGSRRIDVSLCVEADRLVLTLEDEGKAFNPLESEEPDTSLPPEDRPVGGLGIFLVRRLFDRVEYRRDGNRNILRLEVSRTRTG